MTKSQLKFKNVDGVEKAVLSVEIGLGEVHREAVDENSTAVIMPMHVESMLRFMKQATYESAEKGDYEGFERNLEEYWKLKFNSIIGVTSFPIMVNKNDEIEGIDEKEIEFVK